MTTLFVPVSTGPWLTIPAGSTNLPVTNAAGFEVGQKIGIDVGGNYELATVTAVGKAATQTTLSAAAAAGATNIKVAADANMTVGDTLTVGTGGTQGTRQGRERRQHRCERHGRRPRPRRSSSTTMRALTCPTWGRESASRRPRRFAHVSGDAVQALGSGITLDSPLAKGHAYGAAVVNPQATTAGYQGPPAPNQWFGGVLSARAGSIALMDASGVVVVDAMVYGSQQSNSSANGTIASPELATLEG